jgi:hypothetical protein
VGTFALHHSAKNGLCDSMAMMTANLASGPIIIVGTDLIPSKAHDIMLGYSAQYYGFILYEAAKAHNFTSFLSPTIACRTHDVE